MKLHYSQTPKYSGRCKRAFDYLMKLHYSQTRTVVWETTKLFDYLMKLHYSQTHHQSLYVWRWFEITLLSNRWYHNNGYFCSLTTLWNYTTLKHPVFANISEQRLTTLWNYTTLKLLLATWKFLKSLTTLWNYTTLKH